MPFDKKVPGHLPSNTSAGRPRRFPDGYSYENLKRGFEATTVLKKTRALLDMSRETSRDISMYKNLDPHYIKEVKKQMRKKKLGFNDQIPNSLKRDFSVTGMSTTDVGNGLLSHCRSRSTFMANNTNQTASHTKLSSPYTRSPSLTMNRLASLSDLHSAEN